MNTPSNLSRRAFLTAAGAAATLRAQSPGKRPNILFFIADDWGMHAGAYGTKWVNTPSFDRVAREGILFTHAFTSNPKCSPSRASILTGRNTWQLKEAINHMSIFPSEFAVYPTVLEEAGYTIGLTGKGWGPGDYQSTGMKHNPAGHEYQKRTLKPPYSGISNRDYAGNFADFLDARPKDKPFCFWMGTQEPHRAYEEGSGLRAGRTTEGISVPKYYPDAPAIKRDMLDYALEVEWSDRHLGLALKKLEEIGELDNTLIFVTSDHGMPFPRVKGQIYEHAFHVPMAVRWGARVPGGRVVDDFINFRDIAPTICAAAGVKAADTMTGNSFLNILTSKQAGVVDPARDVMIVAKERHDLGRPHDQGYPVRAIRSRQFLYVRNFEPDRWPAGNPETGYRNVDDSPTKQFLLAGFDEYYRMSFGKRPGEELYDIVADPDCVHNLANDPKYAKVKRELAERMYTTLREQGDPRLNGRADFFDTIRYTGPRKHAYDTWLKNQNP
jgi:N-sulfoglucosamine sulfohydrolase